MKPYKEILEKHQFNSELKKVNYKFFNYLEDAVYKGLSADEFREKYDLPQIKYMKKTRYVNREGFDSFINEDAIIPYWEIHHYKSGFSGSDALTTNNRFNEDDEELHFYFTFKSLVPDFFYDKLPGWIENKGLRSSSDKVYKDENGGLVIGFGNIKINKDLPSKQLNKGIQVHVLDDDEDNFNVLSDLMPGGMLSFLQDHKVSDFKPSYLPQMLFITGTNHYIAVTENVNSIVCLESSISRTHFEDSDTEITKLKGNLFVKHDCPLTVSEIGKNTVLGEGTRVHYSAIIGDNVATGYRSILYKDCEISDYSIICDRVQIFQEEKIPAFQIITTRPASFLKNMAKWDLNNFLFFWGIAYTESAKSS